MRLYRCFLWDKNVSTTSHWKSDNQDQTLVLTYPAPELPDSGYSRPTQSRGSSCRVQIAESVWESASVFSWFRLQASGFRDQGKESKVQLSGVQGLGFRVQGSGFRVQGSEFRVRSALAGFRGWGLRFQGPYCWQGKLGPCCSAAFLGSISLHMGTSLIRNSAPLAPYSRNMPRALWWSWGRRLFLTIEVPLWSCTVS